jgi:DNA-binding NarL/FixJ family response regulator
MGTIKVMIADDDEDVVGLVSLLVSRDPELELAGSARDTAEAVSVAASSHPDVALLDLDMPGGGGWKAARGIGESSPATRILAFSGLDTPEARLESTRAGAVDFIAKGSSNEQIIDAIKRSVKFVSGGGDTASEGLEAQPAPVTESASDGGLERRLEQLEARMGALERSLVKLLGQ